MRALLWTSLLALALASDGPAPRTAGPPPAAVPGAADASAPAYRARLLRGRGLLARGGEVVTLGAEAPAVDGEGPATLVLGSLARGEVAWRSLASLRLEGPAELEWGAEERSGDLLLTLGKAARLDVEARRRTLHLELTQGWSLGLSAAAVQLEEQPHGGWIVRHHGGRDVRVRSRVPREDQDWPRVLRAGDEVRLGPRQP